MSPPIEKVLGAVSVADAMAAVVAGAEDAVVDDGLGVSEHGGRPRKAHWAFRASSMDWPAIFPPVEIQKSVMWFVCLQFAQRSLGALLFPDMAARAVLLGDSLLRRRRSASSASRRRTTVSEENKGSSAMTWIEDWMSV